MGDLGALVNNGRARLKLLGDPPLADDDLRVLVLGVCGDLCGEGFTPDVIPEMGSLGEAMDVLAYLLDNDTIYSSIGEERASEVLRKLRGEERDSTP